MPDFDALLGADLFLAVLAAGLVVTGYLTIQVRQRPKPRKAEGEK